MGNPAEQASCRVCKTGGITTLTEANHFLETEYRELFNQRFAVEPEAKSIFVPAAEDLDLDAILCVKHTRKTDAARIFSFKNQCFQILDEGLPKDHRINQPAFWDSCRVRRTALQCHPVSKTTK